MRAIREITRDRRNASLDSRAELLLYCAREAQVLVELVEPALARGEVVLIDRSLLTAEVIGRARGLSGETCADAVRSASAQLEPDLTIVFDVHPRTSRLRKQLAKIGAHSDERGGRKGLAGSGFKRRVRDLNALAGFEKSGHFFFNAPVGRGYDDGVVTAIAVIDMLDRNPGKSMAELYAAVPKTWGTPTMAAKCADEIKYGVSDKITRRIEAMQAAGDRIAGQTIVDVVTVNGVRVVNEDGTWGLIRASSNKPELVVVCESPVSEARMREMFKAIDGVLRENPEVGAYNQTI